eukprot:1556619-Rhodomonas_salina.2
MMPGRIGISGANRTGRCLRKSSLSMLVPITLDITAGTKAGSKHARMVMAWRRAVTDSESQSRMMAHR